MGIDEVIATFKAGYYRTGEIWIEEKATCGVCNELKKCIAIDSSESEYGAGFICKDCVNKLI